MKTLQDRTAIVTGGGRGIGAAIAQALAAQGAAVMLSARSSDQVSAMARQIRDAGGRAEAVSCDVSDLAAVEEMADRTRKLFGPVDILVNNAGVIEPIGKLAQSDPAAWARNIAVNLTGAYHGVRCVLPGMLAAGGGTIINISSGAAHRPLEGWSAYCSGKAGLAMLTQALALECEGSGVRVFGLSPGTIDTDMQVSIRASGINPVSRIPRGDLWPVDYPARAAVYLCTKDADDMIGSEASLRDPAFQKRLGIG